MSWATLADPRAYIGRADGDGSVIVQADGEPPYVLDGATWGGDAGDRRAVAAAILHDVLGRTANQSIVDAFHQDVVATLPGHGFVLTAGDVRSWLLLRAVGRPPADG
jgi:hypothetical protein